MFSTPFRMFKVRDYNNRIHMYIKHANTSLYTNPRTLNLQPLNYTQSPNRPHSKCASPPSSHCSQAAPFSQPPSPPPQTHLPTSTRSPHAATPGQLTSSCTPSPTAAAHRSVSRSAAPRNATLRPSLSTRCQRPTWGRTCLAAI